MESDTRGENREGSSAGFERGSEGRVAQHGKKGREVNTGIWVSINEGCHQNNVWKWDLREDAMSVRKELLPDLEWNVVKKKKGPFFSGVVVLDFGWFVGHLSLKLNPDPSWSSPDSHVCCCRCCHAN